MTRGGSARARGAAVVALGLMWAACGGAPERTDDGAVALQARVGTYSDGSGTEGLALLTTLRDARGAMPEGTWTLTLGDLDGALGLPFELPAGTEGGVATFWWPDRGFHPLASYTVKAAQAGVGVASASAQASAPPLALPQVELTPDGTALTWPAVPLAEGYACRVYAGEALQLSTTSREPGCALGALPPGAYRASVLALNVDLAALRESTAPEPSLPSEFHVSEGRLAFTRATAGAPALTAQAAGGALFYGSQQPGLALWLSLKGANGTPLAAPWQVEILGPGLSSDAPLRLTYPADVARLLVWSYELPATPGRYTLSAVSGANAVSAVFSVGTPAALPAPAGVQVTPGASGAATVRWGAASGARAYYASAYRTATGDFVGGLWVTTTDARFPSGTFAPGQTYDVYVAATNADLSAAQPPTGLAVSENTYLPTSFTAP